MLLKKLGKNNKSKIALNLFIKACNYFYLWKLYTSQCNELTLNSCHTKFKEAKFLRPEGYFKFLERQEEYYTENTDSEFITPRKILGNKGMELSKIKLNSLKMISDEIKEKRIFWNWRIKGFRMKITQKLSILYFRKKMLVKCLFGLSKLTTLKRISEQSEKSAIKYYLIKIVRKSLRMLKKNALKRQKLKQNISNHSLNRSKLMISKKSH